MTPSAGYPLLSVVHLIRPIGVRAGTLAELHAAVAGAEPRTLFYHTRHGRLRHPVGDEAAPDDFSAWINGVLQDREIAERVSFAVQSTNSAEELRAALLEVLAGIPESRASMRAHEGGELVFLTLESVTIPTGARPSTGRELVHGLAAADDSVWFYHLIEQPWFPDGPTVFEWTESIGEPRLAQWLVEDASSGLPLGTLRRQLLRRWRQSRLSRRVSEAALAPEDERREAGHDAVARFVRRITRTRRNA
jgi:hypothetical protein